MAFNTEENPRLVLTNSEINSKDPLGDPLVLTDEEFDAFDEERLAIGDYIRKHEGVFETPQLDTSGNWTFGIGHKIKKGEDPSKMDIEETFSKDLDEHIERAKELFDDFDSFPIDVKKGLVDGVFRGDFKKDHDTVKHINAGEWDKVGDEYINRKDYRESVASAATDKPFTGVFKRLDENADIFRNYSEFLKTDATRAQATAGTPIADELGADLKASEAEAQEIEKLAGFEAPFEKAKRAGQIPEEPTEFPETLTDEEMFADEDVRNHPAIRALTSGAAASATGIAKSPAFIYDALSRYGEKTKNLPGPDVFSDIGQIINTSKKLGLLPEKAPKELRENKVTDWLENVQKDQSVLRERFEDKNIVDVFQQEGAKEASKYLGWAILENAPQQVVILGSTLLGAPSVGLALMGVGTAGETYDENLDRGTDADRALLNAGVQGTIEIATERIGTVGIFKSLTKRLAKAVGKKSAIGVVKQAIKNIFFGAAGEGGEETVASVGQDFSDFFIGENKNALKGMGVRALESGLIGAGSGGGITATTAAIAKVAAPKIAKDIKGEEGFARISKGEGDLTQEAKKFDTAEEFIKSKKLQKAREEDVFVRPDFFDKGKAGLSDSVESFSQNRAALKNDFKKSVIFRDKSGNPQGVLSFNIKEDGTLETREDFGGGAEIFVNPEFRRQGIATKLRNKAKELGFDISAIEGRAFTVEGRKLEESLLTDIFNKAKGEVAEEVTPPEEIKKITTVESLQEKLKSLESVEAERTFLKQLIKTGKKEEVPERTIAAAKKNLEELKSGRIKKKETTIARDKLKNVLRGIREGEISSKKEVKAAQTELIGLLEKSGLEPDAMKQFIRTIKNIETKEQLQEELPVIEARILRIGTSRQVRNLKSKIKKALKPTKIKKQSGKPVGKFTAEVQEVLDLMRQTANLPKSDAEAVIQQNIDASEGLLPSEDIRLKNELLTLMSGLDEKTPESLKTILDTIEDMKKTGKVARRLQRFERTEDIIDKRDLIVNQVTGGLGIKEGRETAGGRKTSKQKFQSTMRSIGHKMVLSWSGLMDALDFNAGVENKQLKKEFSTLDQDNKYKELTEEFTTDLTDAMSEAFKIDGNSISLPWKIGAKINELNQDVPLGKFTNKSGQTVDLIFTKDQLIKKWMELQDPTLRESFVEGNKFTEPIIDAIDKALTPEDKAFARKQFEIYKKQWKKINPIYRELFGANLPFNEFYSPIAREGFNLDVSKGFGSFMHDASTRTAVTSGAFTTRVKNKLPLKTQGSLEVLERHLKETNYFIAWAKRMKTFESVFKDPNVRESIKQEFTSPFLGAIDKTIDHLTNNGNKNATRVSVVDFFRKNFTLGKLMIKANLFAKQTVSTLAYLEKVNPVQFAAGVSNFWLHPIRNYQTLKKESTLIRTRGLSNLERDIKEAASSAPVKSYGKRQNIINLLMLNVKAGDKIAIVMGSWAMRRARLARGGIDIKDIISEYENFSAETQQSSDISRLSEVQRGGSLDKLFTMFKSSQRQYLQKELNAIKSLFQKGGIGPKNLAKVAKVLAIYHILLPVAFQYIANLGGWEDDDKKDYLRAGILGSFNGLFIFGDIVDSIIRKALGLRVFSNENPIMTIADDVKRAVGKVDFEDITEEDFKEAMGELIEAGDSVGVPVSTAKNMYIGVSDILDGDIKAGMAELLGWSPRVVKKGKTDDEKFLEKFKEKLGKTNSDKEFLKKFRKKLGK